MEKHIVSLKSSLIILILLLILFFSHLSCKKCYTCNVTYYYGLYYNKYDNDTIYLDFNTNYNIDSIEKYYLLGYRATGKNYSVGHEIELCNSEFDKLKERGFNVRCNYNK